MLPQKTQHCVGITAQFPGNSFTSRVDPRVLLKDLGQKDLGNDTYFSIEKIDSLSSYTDIYEKFLVIILLIAGPESSICTDK